MVFGNIKTQNNEAPLRNIQANMNMVNKTFCRHCGVPRDNPDNLFAGWKTIYNRRGIPTRKLCPVCVKNKEKRESEIAAR